ncbi:hypothetical protein [Nocardioides cavernaquae]|uniref:LppX_LprAFG lipoprotein n=1 Tax=Nocardioides cavernaquae TaxID=2321396 RepID=A0A3A5HCD9_9ACTN|nr:hypothetical protein [Nocardioides cavernaquae]RJS47538.1 hypothetical protein D4739_15840 [Nocardioides cavernaquae]
MTRQVRRAAASLAVVALASTLTSCGGGDPARTEDKAAEGPCGLTTRRAGHLTLKNASDLLGKAADRRLTQRFRVDETVGKRTVSMEGSGDSTADELTSMDLTMSGADGIGLRLIYLDETMYVSGDGITPEGKFVPIDINDPRDPVAKPMKAELESAGINASLTAWEAGLVGVKYVGKETLDDGSKTEFYEFNVDPRLAARAAGIDAPAGMPAYVTWYVWVDAWNLVHKVQGEVDGGKTTMTFSGYCEPLSIKPPDEEDLIPR